jgi:hypothetical protein
MTKNLEKILIKVPEFFTPLYLKQVSAAELKERVFNNMDFSLLEERARIIREIGTVIEYKYNGKFIDFISESQFDIILLVN